MQGQRSTNTCLWGLSALVALMATQCDAGNAPIDWAALTSQTQLQGARLTMCRQPFAACCVLAQRTEAVLLPHSGIWHCCNGPRCMIACLQAQEMGPAMELDRTIRAHAAMAAPQEGPTLTMQRGTMALT